MTPDEYNEDPAPDFGPELWLTEDIESALNNLLEVLYNEGAGVNGAQIILPSIPGDSLTVQTDFGKVTFEGAN